jgi:superfamily II DNA or RNA helicase
MTEQEKTKIIEKYKKLLALSSSPVKAEAESARKKAESMAKKYNIRKKEKQPEEEFNLFYYVNGKKVPLRKFTHNDFHEVFTQSYNPNDLRKENEERTKKEYKEAMEFINKIKKQNFDGILDFDETPDFDFSVVNFD